MPFVSILNRSENSPSDEDRDFMKICLDQLKGSGLWAMNDPKNEIFTLLLNWGQVCHLGAKEKHELFAEVMAKIAEMFEVPVVMGFTVCRNGFPDMAGPDYQAKTFVCLEQKPHDNKRVVAVINGTGGAVKNIGQTIATILSEDFT